MRSERCGSRGDPNSRPREEDALLPGVDVRNVRQGSRNSSKRDHAILSALAIRRGKGVCILDNRELSRGIWVVRLQRHPVQSRIPLARRNIRVAQDHARVDSHSRRTPGHSASRQSRFATRLGPCAGLREGAMADAAARESRRISSSRPASSIRCATSSSRPARCSI